MRIQSSLLALSVLLLVSPADAVGEAVGARAPLTRDIKIISSAGARALADACTAWAEQNKLVVAMAILDWGGNLIEFHAMEGAPPTPSTRRSSKRSRRCAGGVRPRRPTR